MKSKNEYEAYLRDFIPIVDAMDFRVVKYDPMETIVRAPIGANKSKKEIAFGGCIASLCLASAWSLIECRLEGMGIEGSTVIKKVDTRYLDPIDKDFEAVSRFSDLVDWNRFEEMFRRMGKARLEVECIVKCGDAIGAKFSGTFVVMR